MTYEQAAQTAKERAKMEEWAEEHIASPWKYWDSSCKKVCQCSLCYWRRNHIQKILQETVI